MRKDNGLALGSTLRNSSEVDIHESLVHESKGERLPVTPKLHKPGAHNPGINLL